MNIITDQTNGIHYEPMVNVIIKSDEKGGKTAKGIKKNVIKNNIKQ